jgi:hypothetical protein
MEEEIPMADSQEFASRAVKIALEDAERNLIQAERDYQDALRADEDVLGADAYARYREAEAKYNALTGAHEQQQQQQAGQLSAAQKSFLSRRAAGGDELTPQRWADYARGHDRAVAAGLQPDTDAYFRSIEFFVDHQGDGKQPPLSQTEAAKISGITDEEYRQGAIKLQQLKKAGHYSD